MLIAPYLIWLLAISNSTPTTICGSAATLAFLLVLKCTNLFPSQELFPPPRICLPHYLTSLLYLLKYELQREPFPLPISWQSRLPTHVVPLHWAYFAFPLSTFVSLKSCSVNTCLFFYSLFH